MGLSILRGACLIAAAAAALSAASIAGDLRAAVRDGSSKPVADAVVIAAPLDSKNLPRAAAPTQAVDQVDKQFVPYVKVILAGSTMSFPNSDKIRHQVYSFSPAKKFELPLYAGREAAPVIFDKPGVVVLGCNIHDWMLGYIYVTDTPYFAKTAADGRAILNDLPPGDYRVRIWHPAMDGSEHATAQTVTIGTDGASAEWRLSLKSGVRVPRISGAAAASYP